MFRTTLLSLAIASMSLGCAPETDCSDGTCDARSGAPSSEALRITEEGCDGLREAVDHVSDACASAIDEVIAECRTASEELEDRCENALSDVEDELGDARERLGMLHVIYDRAVAAGDRDQAARAQSGIDDVNAEIRGLLAETREVERRCDAAEGDLFDRCDGALRTLDARCNAAFSELRETAEECADDGSSRGR